MMSAAIEAKTARAVASWSTTPASTIHALTYKPSMVCADVAAISRRSSAMSTEGVVLQRPPSPTCPASNLRAA